MKKNYLIALIAVVAVHALFFVLWNLPIKSSDDLIMFRTDASLAEMLFCALTPVAISVFFFVKGQQKKFFFVETIVALVLALLGCFLDYFNWGFSTKRFFTPDFETKLLCSYIVGINIFLTLALGAVFQIILFIKSRR